MGAAGRGEEIEPSQWRLVRVAQLSTGTWLGHDEAALFEPRFV